LTGQGILFFICLVVGVIFFVGIPADLRSMMFALASGALGLIGTMVAAFGTRYADSYPRITIVLGGYAFVYLATAVVLQQLEPCCCDCIK
jgi:tetrahydromethanopterin S-methyltransferase subunit C